MRNLKKLLAVIVAICVLASFTIPAFAADATSTYGTQAKGLYDMGLFKGESTSEYVPSLEKSLTKEQGIVLLVRLFGKEADAKAMTDADTVLKPFTDAAKISSYAKNDIAYAVKNGWVKGDTETVVGAKSAFTGTMIAAVVLRQLGYTDVAYEVSAAGLVAKGATLTADEAKAFEGKALTRDGACGIMFASLKAKYATGGKTVIETLVAAGAVTEASAIAAGVYTAAPATPAVLSATTDNLKVVKIEFNTEIDSTTVNTTNISATDILDAKLSADKKTVYAIMKAAEKQSNSKDFTIENVKNTAGVVIPKTVKSVTFQDTKVPEISGAVAKNAKNIVISASEPMSYSYLGYQVLNDIKLDGIAIIAKATPDFTTNTISLELSTKVAAGTHKLEVANVLDYAGYKAVTQTYNVEVVADTAAPVITSAKMITVNQVEVTFNEDVNSQGSFWVNGTLISAPVQDTTDKSKFKLNLTKALDIGATVEVKVEYQDQTDVVDNKVSTKTAFTFKVVDDTSLPTVTAAFSADNKLTLTFSKAMLADGVGKIKVVKASDGSQLGSVVTTIAGNFKTDSNNTIMEISASTIGLASIDPTDIKVNIKDMKDGSVRANALTEQNIALKTNDTNKPTVADYYSVTAATALADDTVTFYFSEAMDSATLNNLSNYILNATSSTSDGALSALSGSSVSSIASDFKSVTIKVPGISADAVATFTVYALKDQSPNGNMSIAKAGIAKANSTTGAFSVAAVEATSSTTIDVYFNSKVSSFDPSVFVITKNGVADTSFLNYSIDSTTATKVSLTANKDFGTTMGALKLAPNNIDLGKNVYGTTLGALFTAVTITDKVAPTASVANVTTSGSIVVTFSENVTVATKELLNSDLVVRKADGSLVDVTTPQLIFLDSTGNVAATNANFVKVEISGLTAFTEYTVELIPRSIFDLSPAGNKAGVMARTSVVTN